MQFQVAGDLLTLTIHPRGIFSKAPTLPPQQYTRFARVLSDANETEDILQCCVAVACTFQCESVEFFSARE